MIRAVFDENFVRVYQAYNNQIADEVVTLGKFGPSFKVDRMTWIKPSFLWMMYRCGWGTKENQERILAIDIKREAFDYLTNNAVLSKYSADMGSSFEEWQKKLKESDVIVQWDPEKDIDGNNLDYRSIQIGIRRECVRKYVSEWIVKIEDITDYVAKLKKLKDKGTDISALLPVEKEYSPD